MNIKKRKIVFLLVAFSLVIAFLPQQIYLPSIVGAVSQYTRYLNYSTSLNMMINHLRYFNYSINQNVILTQYLKYYYTYSVSVNITIFRNLYASYAYCTSLGIIVGSTTSSSIPCTPGGGGGGGGGGGNNITVPGNSWLSFITILAVIGTPVLLLTSVAGPPGLFIGLLVGGAMAFMAGLLPLWFIVMLGLATIMLIAFMVRRRE